LAGFLNQMRAEGRSEQSVLGLRNRIPKLLRFVEQKGLCLGEVDVAAAQDFQAWLGETGRADGKPYQATTLRSYLGAAGAFCEYLKTAGFIHTNPFRELRKPVPEKRLPRGLLREKQMNRLLEHFACFTRQAGLKAKVTCYKMHVIAELMYATGLRVSEVAALRPEDLDLQRGMLTVRQGKGGGSRIAYVNEYACGVLRLYLERMQHLVFTQHNEAHRQQVFGSPWPSFSRMVNKNLQAAVSALALGGFTSHAFRHAVGYHLLRAGCPIRYIQQILGHKQIKDTEIYTQVDREDLKKVLDTYHPRRWGRILI
jgi:integrase/recombinase XerD